MLFFNGLEFEFLGPISGHYVDYHAVAHGGLLAMCNQGGCTLHLYDFASTALWTCVRLMKIGVNHVWWVAAFHNNFTFATVRLDHLTKELVETSVGDLRYVLNVQVNQLAAATQMVQTYVGQLRTAGYVQMC